MKDDSLGSLAWQFALLSLMAYGGANAVMPEIHRQAVDVHSWTTERQFTDFFALSQAAPGPNVLIVTLLGWQAAGLPGALVATLAMCGPSSLLAFGAARLWERFREARWRRVVQLGVVPVTVGLIGASAFVLARLADTSVALTGITLGTAALAHWTKIHPLWAIGAAAVAGALGWV
ncbi:MAG: chromate transporter [Verrucomicrobia bacterium]|nr:chromate transporter [Verrucomicrobiota bacterium]